MLEVIKPRKYSCRIAIGDHSAGSNLRINPHHIAIGGDSAGGMPRINPDHIAIGGDSAGSLE